MRSQKKSPAENRNEESETRRQIAPASHNLSFPRMPTYANCGTCCFLSKLFSLIVDCLYTAVQHAEITLS